MSSESQPKAEYVIENPTQVSFDVEKGGPLTPWVYLGPAAYKEAEVGLRGRLSLITRRVLAFTATL